MELKFVIPIPISLNNAYNQNKSGRRFLTSEGKGYKRDVSLIVRSALARSNFEPPENARFGVSLIIHFADSRRRDLDNCIKLPLDAIAETIGFDDTCVDEILARRSTPNKHNPNCEVVLRVM